MESNVIPFPKTEKTETQILYLKLKHQAYIIDLTEQRRRIEQVQKEVQRMRKRFLKVINNADEQGPA